MKIVYKLFYIVIEYKKHKKLIKSHFDNEAEDYN